MRTLATIGCFLLVAVMAVLPSGAGADEPPDYDEMLRATYDEMLRATIIGPELPRDGEQVASLLDKGANPNARDEFGRTAVHYAAGEHTGMGGTGAILKLLLLEGGDCCMQDSQGDTPLHYAVAEGIDPVADNVDVQGRIRNLFEHGADPDEPNRRGYTPLHFAAKTPDSFAGPPPVNSLLQADADPNRAADDGNTPLHMAAGVPVILDSGHGHDLHSRGFLTDSSIAAFDVDAFIVRALLAAGANPNVTNADGMTPLLVSLTLFQESLLHIIAATNALLSADADPNATAPDDMTPLHIVLNYPDSRSYRAHRMTAEGISLIEALLGAGANPDTKNPQGDTPLHVAIRQEWGEDMVKALLAGGADPCIRNDDERWLPEQLARGLGQGGIELALQLAGGSADDCGKREEEKLGLDRNARRRIQSCLKGEGFDPGAPDGLFGPRTRDAIGEWQAARGGREGGATGYLTQAELDDLLADCKIAAPTPLCTGETDTPCWIEIANQPGCYMWNLHPSPEETVTWSGACIDGKASGKGKEVWRFREDGEWKTTSGEGEQRDGKRQGHWVWHLSSGNTWEGPYVDGELHGRWVQRGTEGEEWQCWSRSERKRVGGYAPCGNIQLGGDPMQATDGIVLRSGPGNDYEEIGRLSADDKVEVTHGGSGWVWVETPSGQQGFVLLSVLENMDAPAVAEVEKPAVTEVEEPQVAAVVTEPKCAYGDEILSKDQYGYWDVELPPYSDGYDSYDAIYQIALELGILYNNCWISVENIPDCYMFHWPLFADGRYNRYSIFDSPFDIPRPSISWSGECVNGVVDGRGMLTYYHVGFEVYFKGTYEAQFESGRRHERVSRTYSEKGYDGREIKIYEEGSWENGVQQGKYQFNWESSHGRDELVLHFVDGYLYMEGRPWRYVD